MLNKHLPFLSILGLSLQLTAISAKAAPTYQAFGVAIHQCSCAYACPCMFENGPDNCALAAVYHLEAARYAGVDISGLNMISIDGAAKTNAPSGVVYLDALRQRRSGLRCLGSWKRTVNGRGRVVRSAAFRSYL